MTTAVLDACVLFPAALRDLWMHLTVRFVFQPKWTDEIQDEWIRNVLEKRPDLQPEQFVRTRRLMETAGRDWELPDYQGLLLQIALPDPNDRHVLAAAIAGQVATIVTFNQTDFPEAALAPYGVRAVHPDHFACELLDEKPEEFLLAVRTQRLSLRNPPKGPEEFLDMFRRIGLTQLSTRLEAFEPLL